MKFISEFNAVINSGKSYLGSQQNCHQRTHTAGIKSQPWMVAFQQEPSWCQVAQGGGQQFRTWCQVERPLSDTLGENKVEKFLAHETYLLFTPFPGFHCLSRNVLWPLKNDNIAESSHDRCENSATFKGQLFWSDWPFFHYQVWPLRLVQTKKSFGSGLYMAQRDTWGYALIFFGKKGFLWNTLIIILIHPIMKSTQREMREVHPAGNGFWCPPSDGNSSRWVNFNLGKSQNGWITNLLDINLGASQWV